MNTNPNLGEVSLEKDKENKTDKTEEKLEPGKLFELLGQLRITIRERYNLKVSDGSAAILTLAAQDEIALKKIESIEKSIQVWWDEPNRLRYIINRFDKIYRFSDFDEFLKILVDDLVYEMEMSETYMMEPPRVTCANSPQRIDDPETLGIPMEQLASKSIIDDNARAAIESICVPSPVEGDRAFSSTNCLEYPPRGMTTNNIFDYCRASMINYRARIQMMMNYYNSIRRKSVTNLQPLEDVDIILQVVHHNGIYKLAI